MLCCFLIVIVFLNNRVGWKFPGYFIKINKQGGIGRLFGTQEYSLYANKKVRSTSYFTLNILEINHQYPTLHSSCNFTISLNFSNQSRFAISRSSHQRCSVNKKRCSWKFRKIQTCVGLLFHKVAGLQVSNIIKKRLQHRCFHVKFAKF